MADFAGWPKPREMAVMACLECIRLRRQYEHLRHAWVNSFKVRIESIESAPAERYFELRVITEEAWVDSECARLELLDHQDAHSTWN